jgi:imidazole glycerol-phosphate synthase subunit HisH
MIYQYTLAVEFRKKDFTMIAIVDYEAGNLTSVKRALDFLGLESEITPDAEKVRTAEKIIFPGVGHAASAMQVLTERGLDKALKSAFSAGTPILGICLGTQIILSHSEEGDTVCLGIIEGNCPKFKLKDSSLKIPHMGWNTIKQVQTHPILQNISATDEFYFVHSFYPQPSNPSSVIAVTEYEIEFPVIVGHKNLVATQFHLEKSGPVGLRMLSNFSSWNGLLC